MPCVSFRPVPVPGTSRQVDALTFAQLSSVMGRTVRRSRSGETRWRIDQMEQISDVEANRSDAVFVAHAEFPQFRGACRHFAIARRQAAFATVRLELRISAMSIYD